MGNGPFQKSNKPPEAPPAPEVAPGVVVSELEPGETITAPTVDGPAPSADAPPVEGGETKAPEAVAPVVPAGPPVFVMAPGVSVTSYRGIKADGAVVVVKDFTQDSNHKREGQETWDRLVANGSIVQKS